MKFLITNDDGEKAIGFRILTEVCKKYGEVIEVVPATNYSHCSHSATMNRAINFVKENESKYLVSGTPVDCVRIALLALKINFDWVISGINHGGNLGADHWESGTCGAAREGMIRGVPAIAISQYLAHAELFPPENVVRDNLKILLNYIFTKEIPNYYYWNANLPWIEYQSNSETIIPEILECENDLSHVNLKIEESYNSFKFSSDYNSRKRIINKDISMCIDKSKIVITKMRL
jgi:5'-nucleotidase